jgi:transcriptional regulator with XRE-family HTH domain
MDAMAQINSIIMRRQREKLRLSMEDLQERSGIDKGTIYRIESGRAARNTHNTIEKLARALKLAPDELVAAKADDGDGADPVFSSRSQFNFRISNEARNALFFVGQRYGVRQIDIIELSPLLFQIVAEESLRSRRERLDELYAARETISSLSGKFPHISERLLNDWNAEEMEIAEDQSIVACDIRGEMLDKADTSSDIRPINYDAGEHNPFVSHVRGRLGAIDAEAEFAEWHSGWSPSYSMNKQDVLAYFAGDEDVAGDVVLGLIGLHEIPKELRNDDSAQARLAWARDRMEARSREVDLLENELLEILDRKDLES